MHGSVLSVFKSFDGAADAECDNVRSLWETDLVIGHPSSSASVANALSSSTRYSITLGAGRPRFAPRKCGFRTFCRDRREKSCLERRAMLSVCHDTLKTASIFPNSWLATAPRRSKETDRCMVPLYSGPHEFPRLDYGLKVDSRPNMFHSINLVHFASLSYDPLL